jgi:hypothetical protein
LKVKTKRLAGAILILLIANLISIPTKTMATPKTIYVPGDYATIHEAISAANPADTILVAAGVYNEEVVIDKSLTIIGGGADTTIIDGTGLTLTQSGLVTITAPGDVIFRGFTIRNAPIFPGSDDLRICLLTKSSVAGPTYTISYNRIYGSNNPDEYNDYGFYASHGKENILFTHNLVTETSNNNIVLEQDTGSTEISYNTLDAGVWGTDAIFFMTYGGVDVTTLQNVSCNSFDMSTGGPFDYDHRATGVSFCSVYPVLGNGPEAKFTNMLISGNTFNNLRDNRRAIGFWNAGTSENLVNPIITYNVVNGVTGSTHSSGVDFYGLTTNALVEYNTIQRTEDGVILRSGQAPGTTIHYNNIMNNTVGLDWPIGSSNVDSSYNWWGDPTGPYDPVRNSAGKGDSILGDVSFEPWLVAPYPPSAPVQALLYISPKTTEFWTVSKGQTFTIDVKLANVTQLYGFEFKVYWDTQLLDLVAVQVTTPWSSYFIAKNETREDLGRYWVAASAYLTPAFSGSATLTRLTFKVTYDPIYPANSGCEIDLADTKLSTYEGVPIYHMVHDGSYSIYSSKPSLSVAPGSYTSHYLGETFKVNLTVSNVVDLYNFTVKLSYDTVLLDATSMQLGTFLNVPVYVSKFIIDDSSGLIWLCAWSTNGALPASGSGVLATITFRSMKASLWRTTNPNILSCQLGLYDTLLITNNHVSVSHDVTNGTYHYAPKPGDLDYDGRVGLTDLRTVAYYYDPFYNSVADINCDGKIDVFDLTIVGTHYGEDC